MGLEFIIEFYDLVSRHEGISIAEKENLQSKLIAQMQKLSKDPDNLDFLMKASFDLLKLFKIANAAKIEALTDYVFNQCFKCTGVKTGWHPFFRQDFINSALVEELLLFWD